jgi:hypothetical protein
MRSMPRGMGSIARLARAQGRCNRFPVLEIWATFRLRPNGRALRVHRGPRASLAPMSFISGLRPDGKASARQWTGWTARANTGDGAARRLAPRSSAWCTRGAAGARVRQRKRAAGARQLEWVRNDKTDRPDPRPTPLATYRRCRGPVASHLDLPRRSARRMEPARTLLEPMHVFF